MVFCNLDTDEYLNGKEKSHNPYFNRWFSAILSNPIVKSRFISHNPYFNRWFSAMVLGKNKKRVILTSQSLF